MLKNRIKNIEIYKISQDFLLNKIDSNKYEELYINQWKIIRDNDYWNKIENDILSNNYFGNYFTLYILKAIIILFDLIFESCDAYTTEIELGGIKEQQLYNEVKERFDKINRLLEEIA